MGLVVGACLAENGNDVVCVDKDEAKIATLGRGEMPMYEPGLAELVERNHDAGIFHEISFGAVIRNNTAGNNGLDADPDWFWGADILISASQGVEVSGNTLYKRMWRAVYGAVKQGKKISLPLQKSPLLPRSVVQMIAAGEESGKLGEVLDEVSDFYARELRSVIKAVTAMIEPLMIVVMGGIVGFIAMSIILPIFKLSSIVK